MREEVGYRERCHDNSSLCLDDQLRQRSGLLGPLGQHQALLEEYLGGKSSVGEGVDERVNGRVVDEIDG